MGSTEIQDLEGNRACLFSNIRIKWKASQGKAFAQTYPCLYTNLGLPKSQNVRNEHLCFKPPQQPKPDHELLTNEITVRSVQSKAAFSILLVYTFFSKAFGRAVKYSRGSITSHVRVSGCRPGSSAPESASYCVCAGRQQVMALGPLSPLRETAFIWVLVGCGFLDNKTVAGRSLLLCC